MKYEIEKLKGEVKINFTLTDVEWEEELNKAYLKERGKITVQGFRKGKAPRKVIERMYGPSVFFDEAFNSAFYASYVKALDENPDVFPVDDPKVDIDGMANGISFHAIVTVKPEVVLGDYKGLKIDKKEYPVTAKDVDAEIEKSREQNSRKVEVDRAVENGDIVTLDYKGVSEGVAFEGGTAQDQELVIGSHSFIAGFEEQMVGMVKGETKDLNVTFPTEYHAENLAGKPAVFTVTVKNIQVKEVPALDDEYAKEYTQFETVKEYKADVKAKLVEQNTAKADRENENALLEKVVANATVEIPACMIEKQIDYIIRETEYQLSYMYGGLKFEDYLKYTGMTMESYRDANKARAEQEVKTRLVFEAIIKAENIQASAEQIEEEIAKIASQSGKSVEDFKKDMNDSYNDYVENNVLMNNLIDFLKANNVIEKKTRKCAKKEDDGEEKKPAKKSTKKAKTE